MAKLESDRTVTLSVSTVGEARSRALEALGGREVGQRITFTSPELLWRVLTVKRLEILRAMAGKGAMSIREAARSTGRDVKAVHKDIHALLAAGIVDRTEEGAVEFPYDAVHVDFRLEAA